MKLSLSSSGAILALATLSSARECQDITVDVDISARNVVFDLEAPASNIDVTNFILNLARQGHNYTNEILDGYATVKHTYCLAATYCQPDKGPSETVQLLTHGIGFDRSYWDISANNYNYSYTLEAVDGYGYSTLSWDRLGIAQSEHGEPVNEIQSFLEIAALKSLTDKLREGSIKEIGCSFEKVVHVGHSFGAIQSYSLEVLYPDSSDGLVLQGWSQSSSFVPDFLFGGNFILANTVEAFSDYPGGYLAAGDASGVQTNFFSPGSFDPAILELAYKTGQPVTVGELLTIGGATSVKNPTKAPVLIITGGELLGSVLGVIHS